MSSNKLSNEDFSNREKEKEKEAEKIKKEREKALAVGGTTIGGGLLVAKSQLKHGNLTGRETLYHQTDRKNVSSIKKHGVKASYSQDPNNVTNTSRVGQIYKSQGKPLPKYTYFGKKKFNLSTQKSKDALENADFPALMKEQFVNRKQVKVKAPVWKMKTAQNPETVGINPKSKNRGLDLLKRNMDNPEGYDAIVSNKVLKKIIGHQYNKAFDDLNKNTVTIDGDMSPEYIRGSKHYKRTTRAEIADFIKNNPQRFRKGVAITAAGLGAATLGGAYMARKLNQVKKKKQSLQQKEETRSDEHAER